MYGASLQSMKKGLQVGVCVAPKQLNWKVCAWHG